MSCNGGASRLALRPLVEWRDERDAIFCDLRDPMMNDGVPLKTKPLETIVCH